MTLSGHSLFHGSDDITSCCSAAPSPKSRPTMQSCWTRWVERDAEAFLRQLMTTVCPFSGPLPHDNAKNQQWKLRQNWQRCVGPRKQDQPFPTNVLQAPSSHMLNRSPDHGWVLPRLTQNCRRHGRVSWGLQPGPWLYKLHSRSPFWGHSFPRTIE